MSNVPAHLLAQVQAAVESNTEMDMTVATKGGGGKLYPEGYAFARLVQYIELGNHVVNFQGQAKDPAPQFRLGFLIWGEARDNAGNPVGTYHDAETGNPGFISTFSISQSTNEKAKAFKLFKKLNWRNVHRNFGQMLGEAFLLKIVHTKKEGDGAAKPRHNIDLEGFLPPLDAVSKAPYNVPEPKGDDYKLFLWNHPTKQMWDSLYVEGKYDDGSSKNWLQDEILKATNFPNSPLEQLLFGTTIPSLGAEAVPSVPATPSSPVQGVPQSATPDVPNSVPAAPADNGVTPPWEASATTPVPSVPAQPVVPAGIPSTPVTPTGTPAVPTGVPSMPALPTV